MRAQGLESKILNTIRVIGLAVLLACAHGLCAQEKSIKNDSIAGDSTAVANSTKTSDLYTRVTKRPAIYQGTWVKLDVGATAVTLGISKAKLQHYEMAVNCRLKNRFYPTLEVGYAGGTRAQGDTLHYSGHGGFFRLGCDINPLKKHPESPHALLVGVRIGTAVQHIAQTNDMVAAPTYHGVRGDCWGEIVAGCQVQVYKSLYMGWMGRFKILFTRFDTSDRVLSLGVPIYIPGFGNRDTMGWGVSYHVGVKF